MTDFVFDTVAVIGAGTMGRGIAHVAAGTGSKVLLVDATEEAAQAGMDKVAGTLQRAVEKERIEEASREVILSNITPSDDRATAVGNADVIVEAVPEDLALKQSLFKEFGQTAPAHALLGTNTSSLSVSSIAEGCGAEDRVIGLHFFNPVHIMTLLEVVQGKQTSPQTIEAAMALARRLGKEAILVQDVPGFATSRLGVLLGLEAIRMVEEGVASVRDIDKAMELGYRHPMGPLKLTDLVGLDVRLAIAEHLHGELQSPRFEPPEILKKMVADGKLGKKSGEGFYTY